MAYPETPEDYLIEVIKGSGIDRNWVANLVSAVISNGIKGVGNQVEGFQYKSQPGYANIRTAYNWALSWKKGNPPGASGNGGDPESVRVAWLELITKGKYDSDKDIRPKKKVSKKKVSKAVDKKEASAPKKPRKKGRNEPMDSEEAEELGIKGQSSSLDPDHGVDDYSDVRDMINSGKI